MVTEHELNLLIEHLKRDGSDDKGENAHSRGLYDYLNQLLEDSNLTNDAAIGSAKKAIASGISSLSDAQVKALALDMLKNDVYMEICPNEWCDVRIAWSDMDRAVNDGQCDKCDYRQEKIEHE